MIRDQLARLSSSDLTPENITLITQFINSGKAFTLEMDIVSNVIWKWFKQITTDSEMKPDGLEHLEQYSDLFERMARQEKIEPFLLKQITTKKVETNQQTGFFAGVFAKLTPKNSVSLSTDDNAIAFKGKL